MTKKPTTKGTTTASVASRKERAHVQRAFLKHPPIGKRKTNKQLLVIILYARYDYALRLCCITLNTTLFTYARAKNEL